MAVADHVRVIRTPWLSFDVSKCPNPRPQLSVRKRPGLGTLWPAPRQWVGCTLRKRDVAGRIALRAQLCSAPTACHVSLCGQTPQSGALNTLLCSTQVFCPGLNLTQVLCPGLAYARPLAVWTVPLLCMWGCRLMSCDSWLHCQM